MQDIGWLHSARMNYPGLIPSILSLTSLHLEFAVLQTSEMGSMGPSGLKRLPNPKLPDSVFSMYGLTLLDSSNH